MIRKLAVVVVALGGLAWLFWQSVQSALSEPYFVSPDVATTWAVELGALPPDSAALVALRPDDQLRAELFQQIFNRTMESMISPSRAAVPIVLHDEYRRSFEERLPPDRMVLAAEEAGLAEVTPTPVCIGHVRRAVPGGSRQLYYALFDAPEVEQFRQTLVSYAAEATFAPAPFPLVLPLAASDGDFAGWWPLDVADLECQAPLHVR